MRGGYSPSQGGGQNTLKVNCGHVFANTVRYTYTYTFTSNCIPKLRARRFMLTGDIFPRGKKKGEGGFLIAEPYRAYLA